jgi:hypothetical protein
MSERVSIRRIYKSSEITELRAGYTNRNALSHKLLALKHHIVLAQRELEWP